MYDNICVLAGCLIHISPGLYMQVSLYMRVMQSHSDLQRC